jgi:hypothetical protein
VSPAAPRQVPFTLTCGAPGRLRWVTTNIARFDPVGPWPSDLDCEFKWNTALATFDGGRRLPGFGSKQGAAALPILQCLLPGSQRALWLAPPKPAPPQGAPLELQGNAPSVRLATAPLEMSLTGVASEAAENATSGMWSATVGLPDDGLPEVPPGGARLGGGGAARPVGPWGCP